MRVAMTAWAHHVGKQITANILLDQQEWKKSGKTSEYFYIGIFFTAFPVLEVVELFSVVLVSSLQHTAALFRHRGISGCLVVTSGLPF